MTLIKNGQKKMEENEAGNDDAVSSYRRPLILKWYTNCLCGKQICNYESNAHSRNRPWCLNRRTFVNGREKNEDRKQEIGIEWQSSRTASQRTTCNGLV